MSRARWRRLMGLPWLDDETETLEANAGAGVSFTWPRGTNLTREQMVIAARDSDVSATRQPDVSGAADTPLMRRDWQSGPTPVLGVGPTMPMRSLSDDNHDRVWIAQGDHIEAMGVGDTPQEAAIEYARAVADLLRPEGGPDAFDRKTVIQGREPGERGDAGDGHEPPPDYEVWAR